MFPGLTVGFYATYIYKLVIFSLPQEIDENDDDYSQRINFYSGLVFIVLGTSMAATGFILKFIAKKYASTYDKFKMAINGTLFVEIAGYVSLLCYFLKSYGLCFAVAFLWGCS